VAKPKIDRRGRTAGVIERRSIHGLFYNTESAGLQAGRVISWTCHRLIISGLRRQVGSRLGLLK